MATKREIVSLQFGNYANYIGAHWWNVQEAGFCYDSKTNSSDIDHDVLYREGINHVGQTTYTPRLLLVDLDGACKHISSEGELYGGVNLKRDPDGGATEYVKKASEDIGWNVEDIEVMEEPEVPKNEFQRDLNDPQVNINEKNYNFPSTIKSWDEFLYARYHPRTLNTLDNFKHSLEKQAFDTYSSGVEHWQLAHFEDDFCDKIRMYVEESDYLQGFQMIFDCFNGFSGLATQCLEYLNEEFNRPNFAVPVFSPKSILFENSDEAMTDSIRVINSLFAFNQLSEQSSLFVPLCTQQRVWRQLGTQRSIKSLNYKEENLYETSGILAAYLDTISLRYRTRDTPYTLGNFCGDMSNYGRKLAAAALSLPFPMQDNMDLIDCLNQFEGELTTQLTPNCTIGTRYVVQSLCVRGIPLDRIKRPYGQSQKQMEMPAYRCENVSEMFQMYYNYSYDASMAHVTAISSGMPTRVPYPMEIFDKRLNVSGYLCSEVRTNDIRINAVPVLAAVQVSNDLGDTLETLQREAKRIKIHKIHRFKAAGMEDDDYKDALEKLLLFKDNYDPNYEL